jgi:hypothetical protein
MEGEHVDTETLAAGLNRSVVVTHPTFNGRMRTWRVRIETIERRRTTDLASGDVLEVVSFRGPASSDDGWSGRKTFYAAQCRDLVDEATGETIAGDIEGWLLRTAAGRN